MTVLPDLTKFKSSDHVRLTCSHCGDVFNKTKANIQRSLSDSRRANRSNKDWYCSRKCNNLSQVTSVKEGCANCGSLISKRLYQKKKSKSGRSFCCHSCAALYNNTHKTHGNSRSKLEKWIEQQLTLLYPELEIHFNRKDTIYSELDVYIPSLSLAFELNGVFHYEPIYGQQTLDRTRNNDKRKFQACLERGIEFCTIDTSSQKYFKESTCRPFLNIIIEIIELKLVAQVGLEPTNL